MAEWSSLQKSLLPLTFHLNVIVVRKIGAPNNPELALGAIAEHGEGMFNEDLIRILGVSQNYLQQEIQRQRQTLINRLTLYRGKSPAPSLKDKTIILVDDGIATGASIRAALKSMRDARVKKIVLAVPVAAPDSLQKISKEADEVICLHAPHSFQAVGEFYLTFPQTSDEEVVEILSSFSG